jgi:hypothetical protein
MIVHHLKILQFAPSSFLRFPKKKNTPNSIEIIAQKILIHFNDSQLFPPLDFKEGPENSP